MGVQLETVRCHRGYWIDKRVAGNTYECGILAFYGYNTVQDVVDQINRYIAFWSK